MEILTRILRAMAVALWICGLWPCAAVAQEPREYKIEAAYLYNFFNYVTWPGYASPQELRRPGICLYGSDPIEPYLTYMQHKMAGERELSVHVLEEGASTRGCDILFLRHLLSREAAQSVAGDTLVVLAASDPLDEGGMIELLEENERILIKIHKAELAASGFQISSRLLELAQK